jgi:plastocyanin
MTDNTASGSRIPASLLERARIDRRKMLQGLGALGLAAAGAGRLSNALAQDDATPVSSTPVPGPRDDGTNLWQVTVGGMDMENAIDLQAFFPSELTINAGDAVHFAFMPMGMPGFHTVTFASGGEVPGLFVPDVVDGTPVPSPEGPPRIMLNPAMAWPDGRESYDGTGIANSGVDVFRADAGPYVLTFTAPGTYEYQCIPHGVVMKGTIVVQESGAELPMDQAGADEQGAAERAALIEEGKAAITEAEEAVATPSASGATTWDVLAGAGGMSQARVMSFLPREITIKAGDTVRWTDASIGEPHTVTFLGGEAQPEDSIVEPQAGGPPKIIQSYTTFLPSGDTEFDGTGYHNSGFLGLPPELGEMFGLLGDTYELTFTAPGEYPYYCILHSSGPEDEMAMTGKVIVEA